MTTLIVAGVPENSSGIAGDFAFNSVKKILYVKTDNSTWYALTPAQILNVAAVAGTLTGTVDGTIANVAASACAGGATPAASDVDTAIASLATSINVQLKEIVTILNAQIAATKTSTAQASS